MYKPGIWLPEGLTRPKTLFGTHKAVAYSLIRSNPQATSTDEKVFEAVIRAVQLSTGSCKTTYARRLADLDAMVLGILGTTFPVQQPLSIHDWGASDALVAMEWAELLKVRFPKLSFTASDRILYFTEATTGEDTYIFEPDGTAIQYVKPPFVVSLVHTERVFYVLNRLVSFWGNRGVRSLVPIVRSIRWNGFPDNSIRKHGPWSFRQIPLIHPKALKYARQVTNFRITAHDAFTPLPRRCQVLRAMNLFNLTVFGREKVTIGLRAALASLENGGIFVLGRTSETANSSNNATLFRKVQGRFSVLERLGTGSELETLVNSL